MGKKALSRQFAENEAVASAKSLRVSPQKLNLVADLIRNKPVSEAVVQLDFSKKRISGQVRKILLSAVANAENNHGLDIDRLMVVEVNVGKAFVMKRFMARAKGRGVRILKPYSNLSIVVRQMEEFN